MWRVLAAVVGLLLIAGTYVALAGDLAPIEPQPHESTEPKSFGFALAAGIIALAAVMFMQPRRRRFR